MKKKIVTLFVYSLVLGVLSTVFLFEKRDNNLFSSLEMGIAKANATGNMAHILGGETEVDCYTYLPLGFSTVTGCEGPATTPRKCKTIAFVQKNNNMDKCTW